MSEFKDINFDGIIKHVYGSIDCYEEDPMLRCMKAAIRADRENTPQQQKLKLPNVYDSIDSMKKAMDSFKEEVVKAREENPDDLVIKGAEWGYNKALEQFHNRFSRYYSKITPHPEGI
jgi:hypothetical protein